jgi:hypothetical protein
MAVALTQSRGIDRCRQVRAGKDNTQMTEMARPFGGEVRRLMAVRGVGLREPARRVSYDPGYLSKVVNGLKPVSADLARLVDAALEAGGSGGVRGGPGTERLVHL